LAIGSGCFELNCRSLAAAIGFQFVLDALVLIERAHSGAFYGRDVDECIVAAFIGSDKTETLGGIEKLYGAYWHGLFLSRNMGDRPATGRSSVEA
jgi:hypothetical protein